MIAQAQKIGAAALVISGALLVASLLLSWWGTPPALLDPPANAPTEITFMAESLASSPEPWQAVDAFEYYELRDVVWLIVGIACFGLGLGLLLGLAPNRWLLGAVGIGAFASLVLVAMALIWPPDYLELSRELVEEADERDPFPETTFDVPFGREIGPWIALLAAAGAVVGAVIAGRARARSS